MASSINSGKNAGGRAMRALPFIFFEVDCREKIKERTMGASTKFVVCLKKIWQMGRHIANIFFWFPWILKVPVTFKFWKLSLAVFRCHGHFPPHHGQTNKISRAVCQKMSRALFYFSTLQQALPKMSRFYIEICNSINIMPCLGPL